MGIKIDFMFEIEGFFFVFFSGAVCMCVWGGGEVVLNVSLWLFSVYFWCLTFCILSGWVKKKVVGGEGKSMKQTVTFFINAHMLLSYSWIPWLFYGPLRKRKRASHPN